MSVRARVAIVLRIFAQNRARAIIYGAAVACLAACSNGFKPDPAAEYSGELALAGDQQPVLTRALQPGTYVIEVRERDIDMRVIVAAGDQRIELADPPMRHGYHFAVVRPSAAAELRVTLRSMDQRTKRGAGEIRIMRWPAAQTGDPVDERLLGYLAWSKGGALLAHPDEKSWRASVDALREAGAHFLAADDERRLAAVEYTRAYVEYNLLSQWETSARTAESAREHFENLDDTDGAMRAGTLRATAELEIAAGMSADTRGGEQRALLETADRRLQESYAWFAAHGPASDEIYATNLRGVRHIYGGDYDSAEQYFTQAAQRARAVDDQGREAMALGNLAHIHITRGEIAPAAAAYERLITLIDRERQPDFYASLLGNYGYCLIALGDFDRALALHTEALEVFSARNDVGQRARELSALGALYFRSGSVERALDTTRSALPLFESSGNLQGLVAALRVAGNAAAELGQHDLALEYLRKAESADANPLLVERTRVLIAGQLRVLGDLRGANDLLTSVLNTKNQQTRADALAERARLRVRQGRPADALVDLREADAIYARLDLDFNRIDTSAALAMALAESGDRDGAERAADTAVAIETRIRVKSANPELRARFLSASYAPYEARIAVDLAAAEPRDPDAIWKAFRTAEAVRARSLADTLMKGMRPSDARRDEATEKLRARLTDLQLRLEELVRDSNADEGKALEVRRSISETRAQLETRVLAQRSVTTNRAPTIASARVEVQQALPADTAVLAYFVGDDSSHAWLLTRSQLRHATLPGRQALHRLVSGFVERQRTPATAAGDSEDYSALLGKLLDDVTEKRLLVLPDGPLNGLPFAALPLTTGARAQLLVDRFVLASSPSLALAMAASRPRAPARARVAVISDPVYAPDDGRLTVAASTAATNYRGPPRPTTLTRLPFSAIEARAVVRAFDGAETIELKGFDATAQRVLELRSTDLTVLHFATHAVARKDSPEQSALLLSEYSADGTPLTANRLTADDIVHSGLRADVVVLSGCATGDGSELRGEGVLGLTYGFLSNGSHTVVASLWPIQDSSTARFMDEFYRAYRSSGRAADALRAAQLRMRGDANATVWSSFVVRANEFP